MGWAGLASFGAGVGQQDAKNPGASLGSDWEHNTLARFDPIGKWGVGIGGDPWNLYGEKDNPNALFFPSGNGAPTVPTTLPNLGAASLAPKTYNPSAFGPPALSGGFFNRMTEQMAGPVYSGGRYIPGVSPFMPPPRAPLAGGAGGGKGVSLPGGKGGLPGTGMAGAPHEQRALPPALMPLLRKPMPGPRNPP